MNTDRTREIRARRFEGAKRSRKSCSVGAGVGAGGVGRTQAEAAQALAEGADVFRQGAEGGIDAMLHALEVALEAADFAGGPGVGGVRKAGAVELEEQFLAGDLTEAANGRLDVEAEDVADGGAAHAAE